MTSHSPTRRRGGPQPGAASEDADRVWLTGWRALGTPADYAARLRSSSRSSSCPAQRTNGCSHLAGRPSEFRSPSPGHLFGRICRWVAPPPGRSHGDPGGLEVGPGRLAPHARRRFNAAQRPTQLPESNDLLLLRVAQNVGHAGGGGTSPHRRVNVLSAYSLWPVFRCPCMAAMLSAGLCRVGGSEAISPQSSGAAAG